MGKKEGIMARILIEGNHEDLAKAIRDSLGLPLQEPQLTHNANYSLRESRPRILIFNFSGVKSTQEDFLRTLRSEKIPFIALIEGPPRYYKEGQNKRILLAQEAMELGAIGVFYSNCHENIFCLEELVRRIKEKIYSF